MPELTDGWNIANSTVAWQSISKEIFWSDRGSEKHIIIKENKLLCQIINSMKIEFNRISTKRGKIFGRDIIGMLDEIQLGMIEVKPRRDMSTSHKVNLPHPWGIGFNSSKPILQRIPIPIAYIITIKLYILLFRILFFIFLPFRVIAIYP